jgi:hypothetical protein
MSFAVPAALWGLLVLPVIVLLYMLRTRRQDLPVSTLLLWQRARRELAAHRPVRRFERSLLLLLQLLAAAFLVLALARPQVRLPGAADVGTVVVVDVSASMQATDVAPSRFDLAIGQAHAAVDDAPGPVMVIAAAASPRIATPFGERSAAHGILDALRPTDGSARIDQAVTLALGQRRPGGVRVEVFTDRAGAAVPGVGYHVLGRSGANVGIASVAVEPVQRGSLLVVQVHNGGPLAQRVPVVVSQNGRRLAARTVVAASSAVTSVTLPISASGVVQIVLEHADVLPVDDTAHAIVGSPPPRVVLAGATDRVLAEALAAIPVRVTPAQRVTPEALAAADVIILNRTAPAELPPGNYLLLGTTALNLPLEAAERIRAPQVLRWAARHPVMRYVRLDEITIGEALRLVPRGGEALVEGETPLLWAYEGEGIRAIVSAFTLDQSDLALHLAFPILLQNALAWLGGAERVYPAGGPIILPSRDAAEAEVQWPDGTIRRLVSSGGRFVIPAADRAGLYTVRAGAREEVLVVNPSAEEIAVAPLAAPAGSATAAPLTASGTSDVWRLLIFGAVAVLALEWWLWARALPRKRPRRGDAYLLRPERQA